MDLIHHNDVYVYMYLCMYVNVTIHHAPFNYMKQKCLRIFTMFSSICINYLYSNKN